MEFLVRDTGMFESSMYCSVVNRDEAVGLEEVEEFIEEHVGICMHQAEAEQVLNIVMVKGPR